MRGFLPGILCAITICASSAYGQGTEVQPLHATAGTVLTFYSQTRLKPGDGNVLDALPKGTEVKVKLLESIDSRVGRDGLEFRGVLNAPLTSGNEVIVHADAEVHGLLVLLRSRNHPDGFRYELLITNITENGKTYNLTAALSPSFFDAPAPVQSSANEEQPAKQGQPGKDQATSISKIPAN
jgi:hypothetical protein